MAFYIGKMRGSVPDAAMGMDVVALFPHRCRLPVFRQTAFTGRSGLFQDGTRNNASGSMIISNCRTSDNCWYLTCRVYCCELSIAALRFAHPRPVSYLQGLLLRIVYCGPALRAPPPPPFATHLYFFNGILELVFFIRLGMALLIRLIMALFTRPEIGLFHPTLTLIQFCFHISRIFISFEYSIYLLST